MRILADAGAIAAAPGIRAEPRNRIVVWDGRQSHTGPGLAQSVPHESRDCRGDDALRVNDTRGANWAGHRSVDDADWSAQTIVRIIQATTPPRSRPTTAPPGPLHGRFLMGAESGSRE